MDKKEKMTRLLREAAMTKDIDLAFFALHNGADPFDTEAEKIAKRTGAIPVFLRMQVFRQKTQKS